MKRKNLFLPALLLLSVVGGSNLNAFPGSSIPFIAYAGYLGTKTFSFGSDVASTANRHGTVGTLDVEADAISKVVITVSCNEKTYQHTIDGWNKNSAAKAIFIQAIDTGLEINTVTEPTIDVSFNIVAEMKGITFNQKLAGTRIQDVKVTLPKNDFSNLLWESTIMPYLQLKSEAASPQNNNQLELVKHQATITDKEYNVSLGNVLSLGALYVGYRCGGFNNPLLSTPVYAAAYLSSRFLNSHPTCWYNPGLNLELPNGTITKEATTTAGLKDQLTDYKKTVATKNFDGTFAEWKTEIARLETLKKNIFEEDTLAEDKKTAIQEVNQDIAKISKPSRNVEFSTQRVYKDKRSGLEFTYLHGVKDETLGKGKRNSILKKSDLSDMILNKLVKLRESGLARGGDLLQSATGYNIQEPIAAAASTLQNFDPLNLEQQFAALEENDIDFDS